eukprot:3085014-Amphidinium_carterae.1
MCRARRRHMQDRRCCHVCSAYRVGGWCCAFDLVLVRGSRRLQEGSRHSLECDAKGPFADTHAFS